MGRQVWVQRDILPLFDQGKDLEVRVRSPYFENVSVGDVLIFNESVRRRVAAIRRYGNFVAMLQQEHPDRILPNAQKLDVLVTLRGIFPSELERRGAVVFELCHETA